MLPALHRRSLYISFLLYIIVSPISTYNTLAMFGLVVHPVFVAFQIAVTVLMIVFAIIASQQISKHCRGNPAVRNRIPWIVSFWVIGPPMLLAYYLLRFKTDQK